MPQLTIEVHPLRLMAQRQSAEMYVKHGMHLARNIGTVQSIRDEYHLPQTVRTWKQLAVELRKIEAMVEAMLEADRKQAERERHLEQVNDLWEREL